MKIFKRGEAEVYYYRDFGKVLAAIRCDLGISQKEAAKMAKIGDKYLRSIERGKLNLEDEKLNNILLSLGKRFILEKYHSIVSVDMNLTQKQKISKFLGVYAKLK